MTEKLKRKYFSNPSDFWEGIIPERKIYGTEGTSPEFGPGFAGIKQIKPCASPGSVLGTGRGFAFAVYPALDFWETPTSFYKLFFWSCCCCFLSERVRNFQMLKLFPKGTSWDCSTARPAPALLPMSYGGCDSPGRV